MAVYARGYRPYEGGFTTRSGATAIFWQGFRNIVRTRSFKILGVLILLFYAIFTITLYVQLNLQEYISREMSRRLPGMGAQSFDFGEYTVRQLQDALLGFYGLASTIGALLSMLGGSGIIADDLRTRALPLYLVRPIRPIDYVVGKALVLPAVLAIALLFPGISFYLLAGLWQPDGTSTEWLWNNFDVLVNVFNSFLIASLGFTGLMLLLSARTPRRGAVMGIAAAVYFGGAMLAGLGAELRGGVQGLLKHVSLIMNSVSPFVIAEAKTDSWRTEEQMQRLRDRVPDPTVALFLAIAVLLVGCIVVYRRARSTEVSE